MKQFSKKKTMHLCSMATEGEVFLLSLSLCALDSFGAMLNQSLLSTNFVCCPPGYKSSRQLKFSEYKTKTIICCSSNERPK